MPRQRDEDMFDEYDARSYAHLIPGSHSQQSQQFNRKHEKRKKSKHKSRKRSKEKGERSSRDKRDNAEQNSTVEMIGRTSIVDYEDVSSDSGSLSDVSGTQQVGPSRMEPSSRSSSKRDQSPASAIRSYMNERSHSNSPVINETSPYRTEKSARKSKKRHRSPPVLEPVNVKRSDSKLKYGDPPKAYAEPPKAYADMSLSKSMYRNHSPPQSQKKRHRSRSPSPYGRRSRSRYVQIPKLSRI